MARGNRCYLCGGNLRKGRCVECGLDNDRMTKRKYRLNETTPAHIKYRQMEAQRSEQMKYAKEYKTEQYSLENLGREQDQRKEQRRAVDQQRAAAAKRDTQNRTVSNTRPAAAQRSVNYREYQQKAGNAYADLKNTLNQRVNQRQQQVREDVSNKKKWNIIKVIGIVYVLIMVISALGSCISDFIDEISYRVPDYIDLTEDIVYDEDTVEEVSVSPYISDDEYDYVTRELSETGEYFDDLLFPGYYQIGVHIPEGIYTLEMTDGSYGSIWLDDDENSIYLSLSFGDGEDEYQIAENVRLYEGALLEVYGDVNLRITSENAQSRTGMENPISADTIVYFSENETYVVGVDIPEGVYDLWISENWASVDIVYEDEHEYEYSYHYWMDADTLEYCYKNIVLVDGMEITPNYGDVHMTVSTWIANDDYQTLYEEIYQ